MKLKTIASLFNRNKRLTIYTAADGEQWIGNGIAMYSLRGMPHMTPPIVLRIFDVPPDKYEKWVCAESDMPTAIDFSDDTLGDTHIRPLKIGIEWSGDNYLLFPDERRIYSFNIDYLKPLIGDPYLMYHKRETKDGGFVLACKVGLELEAIVAPFIFHENDGFVAEIAIISGAYGLMHSGGGIINAARSLFGADAEITIVTPRDTNKDPDEGGMSSKQREL